MLFAFVGKIYKELHINLEENKKLKEVVSMYKSTCRELKLRVGQNMADLIKR